MKPLLSILVPTYNRAILLERLIHELEQQLSDQHCSGLVEVLIADNASDDTTSQILNYYSNRNRSWTVIRHATNIGPEANMLSLIVASTGSYRWVIGDDDLPWPGLLAHIIELLRSNSPSLVYLPSEWAPDISTINPVPIQNLHVEQCSSLKCARDLNIWVTFISSWIFSADQLFSGLATVQTISSGMGTYFLPLGWILPFFVYPKSRILVVDRPCILATSGNTGGYAILQAFMVNYPRLVHSYTCGFLRVRHALIGKSLRSYMPSLIMSVRLGNSFYNAGDSKGVLTQSIKFLWRYPDFWLFSIPALLCPVKLVQTLRSCKAIAKRRLQKVQSRMSA